MFDANLRLGIRKGEAVVVRPYSLNPELKEIGLSIQEVYLAIKLTKHSIRILINGVWFKLEEDERRDKGSLIVFEGRPDLTGFIDEHSLYLAKKLFGEV